MSAKQSSRSQVDVREKAEELQQRGQDIFGELREGLPTFVEGKNKDLEVAT